MIEQNKVYVFAMQNKLEILNNCTNWFCDHTSDVVTAQCPCNTHLVNQYCLAPHFHRDKSEAEYNCIFHLMEQQ